MATYDQMLQEAIMRGQYDAAKGKPCHPPYPFRAANNLYKAGYYSEVEDGGLGSGWGDETETTDAKPASGMTREEYQDKIDKERW